MTTATPPPQLTPATVVAVHVEMVLVVVVVVVAVVVVAVVVVLQMWWCMCMRHGGWITTVHYSMASPNSSVIDCS